MLCHQILLEKWLTEDSISGKIQEERWDYVALTFSLLKRDFVNCPQDFVRAKIGYLLSFSQTKQAYAYGLESWDRKKYLQIAQTEKLARRLGDLAFLRGNLENADKFYRYNGDAYSLYKLVWVLSNQKRGAELQGLCRKGIKRVSSSGLREPIIESCGRFLLEGHLQGKKTEFGIFGNLSASELSVLVTGFKKALKGTSRFQLKKALVTLRKLPFYSQVEGELLQYKDASDLACQYPEKFIAKVEKQEALLLKCFIKNTEMPLERYLRFFRGHEKTFSNVEFFTAFVFDKSKEKRQACQRAVSHFSRFYPDYLREKIAEVPYFEPLLGILSKNCEQPMDLAKVATGLYRYIVEKGPDKEKYLDLIFSSKAADMMFLSFFGPDQIDDLVFDKGGNIGPRFKWAFHRTEDYKQVLKVLKSETLFRYNHDLVAFITRLVRKVKKRAGEASALKTLREFYPLSAAKNIEIAAVWIEFDRLLSPKEKASLYSTIISLPKNDLAKRPGAYLKALIGLDKVTPILHEWALFKKYHNEKNMLDYIFSHDRAVDFPSDELSDQELKKALQVLRRVKENKLSYGQFHREYKSMRRIVRNSRIFPDIFTFYRVKRLKGKLRFDQMIKVLRSVKKLKEVKGRIDRLQVGSSWIERKTKGVFRELLMHGVKELESFAHRIEDKDISEGLLVTLRSWAKEQKRAI